MTLRQTYHCKACDYRFGPVAVGPYMPSRPQVFRFCRDCSFPQTQVMSAPDAELRCVSCQSVRLEDVRDKCPLCGAPDVHWEPVL